MNNPLHTNLTFLRNLIAFAYEQGYHEHGYDVLAEACLQLRAAGTATVSKQPAEPDGGQAPIVRVRVEQRGTTVASGGKLPHYMIVHQSMYAPGLPSGEHDLYCAPVPAGDLTWRDEIQFECAHAMEKGDYRGAVLSIYGLMQRACPALTKAGSEI